MHCETHSPSKKQCFNKDNGFIQGTSFVLVSSRASGVQYERGVVDFFKSITPAEQIPERETNALRQKMKHFNPSIKINLQKVYPILYTIYTVTYKHNYHFSTWIHSYGS